MEPIVGMKLKRTVSTPKRKAISTRNETRRIKTNIPVTREVRNLVATYRDMLCFI